MRGRGLRNIFDLRIEEHEVILPGLPPSFEGFRIMQLADLHCDLEVGIMDSIREVMSATPHDAIVLTGDYHNKVSKPFDRSLEEMTRLVAHLHSVRFAIPGNHDFLEMVAPP